MDKERPKKRRKTKGKKGTEQLFDCIINMLTYSVPNTIQRDEPTFYL